MRRGSSFADKCGSKSGRISRVASSWSSVAGSCSCTNTSWELPDDGTNFINFFNRADVLELQHWATVTRQRRNEEGYMVEEPVIPENFRIFLVEYHGTQWEIKFLGAAAEPLFAQLLSYVAGYSRLTNHNKRIFRQSFETWSLAVKREQLKLLAKSGGFLELE